MVDLMSMLLTDDEAVAIAGRRSVEFPAWLPTVARIPGETLGAALRGTRSLLVRGLADEDDDGLIVGPRAAGLLAPFVDKGWSHRCFSYATVSSFPVAAGGVRVFATNADDEWHLDEVSNFGIHSIRAGSRDEYETHARAFVDADDTTYPATGGLQNHTTAISVFSEGLSDELVLKAEDGFYLAGAAGRDDLPLAVPGSEFAFRRIDAATAAARMGV